VLAVVAFILPSPGHHAEKNNRLSGRPPYGAITSAQAVYFFLLRVAPPVTFAGDEQAGLEDRPAALAHLKKASCIRS
jgi:hypothetical protein